jgi:hypothetical protein
MCMMMLNEKPAPCGAGWGELINNVVLPEAPSGALRPGSERSRAAGEVEPDEDDDVIGRQCAIGGR